MRHFTKGLKYFDALRTWTLCGMIAMGIAACGSEEDGSTTDESQAASCKTTADCPQNHVCLAVGAHAGCTPVCTGNVNACGANATCGSVGVMSVNVCQEASSSSTEDPPKAEEQPRIPCQSDAECGATMQGAICAQYKGVRDCTIPCTSESQCDMPSLNGMSIDFMTCIADEGQPSRKACLPDEKCFTNPTACVKFGPF